jgi:hypothetical protein
MQVYAFAKIDDDDARALVYDEIRRGKSRFGMWDQEGSLLDNYHGRNGFLLRIQPGDWIVHVNSPHYGRCVAVQSVGNYAFDEGIPGGDFGNYIPVDPLTIIEFDRNDPNVLPSVNLWPLKRGQRILAVDDFLQSLDNLRSSRHSNPVDERRGLIHLRSKLDDLVLPQITAMIQQMHRSKEFERFLHEVFSAIPNATSQLNGFGWKSDEGADLIVEFQSPVFGLTLTTKLVVQAKSYQGDHYDLGGVEQLVNAIKHFGADGGLLITTAQKTEFLEDAVRKASETTGKTIDVIAGSDVARFVLRNAPHLLVGRS